MACDAKETARLMETTVLRCRHNNIVMKTKRLKSIKVWTQEECGCCQEDCKVVLKVPISVMNCIKLVIAPPFESHVRDFPPLTHCHY